ncbi:MAG: hypothetical protein SGI83_10830 [Bacteroidota bacterium]|nr:hypothetical protein [Bacteroidota bacterium]
MNKLIIGLLIVAAGAGVFFFLRKQKETTIASNIRQEWILGKWETDSFSKTDSASGKYQFYFQKNGILILSLNDSAKADTAHYEWNKASELIWKENATDSTGKAYVIAKMTQDSLQMQSADSATILFTKLK